MHEWHSFLEAADEWFITYSLPPPLTCVKLFAVGHTVELYLKAANTKFTKDINSAINFGHNIKSIWNDCKRDSKFMPSFEIRDSVFNRDFLLVKEVKSLDKDDRLHFFDNPMFFSNSSKEVLYTLYNFSFSLNEKIFEKIREHTMLSASSKYNPL